MTADKLDLTKAIAVRKTSKQATKQMDEFESKKHVLKGERVPKINIKVRVMTTKDVV